MTDDYADIRREMNAVASYFGQEVLRGITLKDILDNFKELQEKFGDRSILRAVHFIEENERVENEVNALISGNIDEFLRLVSNLVIHLTNIFKIYIQPKILPIRAFHLDL